MIAISRRTWLAALACVLGLAPPSFADDPKAKEAAEPKYPTQELIGQPAPDFTLRVLDADGKTKEVSKADLAGKVVMIDFWATWCPPCMAELPEVAKLIEAYNQDDAKKGKVVVVALSVDRTPSEFDGVRALVEKTLADKKLELASGTVGLVAIDQAGDDAIGKAFKVRAIPTVVILDGTGVVQSVHVGYNPKVREQLTGDIDALLAGKALAGAVPAAKPAEEGQD